MKQIISILAFQIALINLTCAQGTIQTFPSAGFKVKCGCQLKENTVFIEMAKQQGQKGILGAFICAENENNPKTGVIFNINVYDESSSYDKISPSDYSKFEAKSLEVYSKNLASAGISFDYITIQGVSALEYTFDQNGLPTKAIFFLKKKNSYLLQVGTRADLKMKFSEIKNSFQLM